MKTFEVKIKKSRGEKETSMEFPSWWGEVYEQIDVVAYEDNPEALGKHTEGAVCVCDDATWVLVAAKNDPLITELDETEANEKGRAWRPQTQRITDESAVLSSVAKLARGEKLSKKEADVLDPDSNEPGVGKSRLFDVRNIALDRNDVLKQKGE